jgi:hypothetical protein
MERIKDSKLQRLKPVKLYREDLEEFVELFTKTCATVELRDEEFIYTSLAEIESRKGTGAILPYIHIQGYRPYVSLELGSKQIARILRRESTYVYAESDDKAELLATRLSSHISRRKRFLANIFNWYVFVSGVTLQWIWTLVSIANRRKDPNFLQNHHWAMVLEVIYYMLLAYMLVYPFIALRGISLISLGPKHAQKSFWAEHGYDLFKGILLVTLGVGLKLLFDHFTK